MISKASIYYPRAMHGDGGVTNSLWLWAESLARAGVQVEVLFDARLPLLQTRRVPDAVSTRAVPHAGSGRLIRPIRLADQLDRSSLLMLHSGYVLSNLVAGREARRCGVPYTVMPQGAYNTQVRGKRKVVRSAWEIAERRMLEHAAAVHVALAPEVSRVRDLAPAARTVTAATALELPDVRWVRPGTDRGYVAWLGRYDVEHKGLDRLLDAMAMLPALERPDLRLHGRDHHQTRSDIQRMVDGRRLTDHVQVGPPVDGADKQHFLLAADAYVHPSRWESFPVAMLEALAYGVPCVTTTDIDLGRELSQAEAALVVDGDVAGLAEGLRRAAARTVVDYGPRGRDYVRDRLNHAVAARVLLEQLSSESGNVARRRDGPMVGQPTYWRPGKRRASSDTA